MVYIYSEAFPKYEDRMEQIKSDFYMWLNNPIPGLE